MYISKCKSPNAGINRQTGVLTVSELVTSEIGGQRYQCSCGTESRCYDIHGEFCNKVPELHVQVQRVGQSAYYFGVAKGDRRTGEGKYLGLPQGIYR